MQRESQVEKEFEKKHFGFAAFTLELAMLVGQTTRP